MTITRWTPERYRRKSAAARLMWQRRADELRRAGWGAILLSEMG